MEMMELCRQSCGDDDRAVQTELWRQQSGGGM